MKSRWQDDDALRMVKHYAAQGVAEDLALRVYTSRLLGQDPTLVLHGGGNTSVKTRMVDVAGDALDVICVKGSGWDMAAIEPAGIPAVRLAPLLRLRGLAQLSDEDMVNALRGNLLDSRSPTPSVETLLHAFVPHSFIDHTHANAVLAVSDQADGLALCAEVFGPSMAIVDYVMPGFQLAMEVARVFEASPDIEGLILHKHGIFTFGNSALQAYERMVAAVTRAEDYIAARIQAQARPARAAFASPGYRMAQLAPMVRGAVALPLSQGGYQRMVAEIRTEGVVAGFCGQDDLQSAAWDGVITPDHNIRIKNQPLVLPMPEGIGIVEFRDTLRQRLNDYVLRYHAYFQANDALLPGKRTKLDPYPRVVLIQGLGLIAFGKSKKDAIIHADLAEATMQTLLAARAIGAFEPLPERALFEMEYWSLEQAKLGQGNEPALARQVVLVTGAAGAIGLATARLFAQQGAELVLLDRDASAVREATNIVGGKAVGLACDVTNQEAVRASFDIACEVFGGIDIVISNAGAAWEGAMATLDDSALRKSFELNFFAHQTVAQNAVRVMLAQGTGGVLLFNASKQAVNPGVNFGAYGAAKAATMLLCRQYALEHGADGIRSNAVNADRVRSGLLTDAMIGSRSRARGLSEDDYMRGNLLGQEVLAQDVAQSFLALALSRKTTGHVMTVDGGNVAAALR